MQIVTSKSEVFVSFSGIKLISVFTGASGDACIKNDCAVRAFANITGCSYGYSHNAFEQAGREYNKGVTLQVLLKMFSEDNGFEITVYGKTKTSKYISFITNIECKKGTTIGSLLKDPNYKTGNYAVLIRGHVFAMIDGVVLDNGYIKANSVVSGVFKLKTN